MSDLRVCVACYARACFLRYAHRTPFPPSSPPWSPRDELRERLSDVITRALSAVAVHKKAGVAAEGSSGETQTQSDILAEAIQGKVAQFRDLVARLGDSMVGANSGDHLDPV